MTGETKATFADWLSAHPHPQHIANFIDWVIGQEETETGKPPKQKRQRQLEEAILYLDDLSMHLENEGILEVSMFKPYQFFNPDKLMRAAKKNGLIGLTLGDIPLNRRPELEENLWYTMRLYSIYLDFYKLSPEEAASFAPQVKALQLPKSVVRNQLIGWGFFTVFFFLLMVTATAALFFSGKTVLGVGVGLLLTLAFAFWMQLGLRQSLPFQFKRMVAEAELYCIRGQICDVEQGRPFSSVNYQTQTLYVSPLHDSLGKSFLFFAINPVGGETDGRLYQVVFIKDMNIAIETMPL